MIAGDRRRDGKQQRDRSADEWRSGHGEGELSRAERGDPGDDPNDDPNDDPADHAGTAVERSEAHRDACEKGKRVEGKHEQQPTEKADSEDAEDDSDDYDGGLRDRSHGRAPTTSTAQVQV